MQFVQLAVALSSQEDVVFAPPDEMEASLETREDAQQAEARAACLTHCTVTAETSYGHSLNRGGFRAGPIASVFSARMPKHMLPPWMRATLSSLAWSQHPEIS